MLHDVPSKENRESERGHKENNEEEERNDQKKNTQKTINIKHQIPVNYCKYINNILPIKHFHLPSSVFYFYFYEPLTLVDGTQ